MELLKYLLQGGFMMFPLMACSILAVAVIIDRLRAYKEAAVDTGSLRQRVMDLIDRGEVDKAMEACRNFGGPVAAVLLVGLRKYKLLSERNRPMTEIEDNVNRTMNDYAPHVIEALEKRLNLLTLIGSTSPLLGMAGTVLGMISAFAVMASEAGLDPAKVAGGIQEALVTTAAGLLIAIPAVVAHNVFTRQVDRYVLDIEESATELIDFITIEKNPTGNAA